MWCERMWWARMVSPRKHLQTAGCWKHPAQPCLKGEAMAQIAKHINRARFTGDQMRTDVIMKQGRAHTKDLPHDNVHTHQLHLSHPHSEWAPQGPKSPTDKSVLRPEVPEIPSGSQHTGYSLAALILRTQKQLQSVPFNMVAGSVPWSVGQWVSQWEWLQHPQVLAPWTNHHLLTKQSGQSWALPGR